MRDKLDEHRRLWARKPDLRAVYADWFAALLRLAPEHGRALEVGAGPGFLAEEARRARPGLRYVAVDVIDAPWNDVAGDACALPFDEKVFDVLLGLDVMHHLARPGAFFREAARVLRPGAPLAVIEPWVTPFSYPIYRFLHEEGLRPGLDPWHPFDPDLKQPFDGDGGVFTRLVRRTPAERWRDLGFSAPGVTLINGFAYLLTLGFREISLLPRPLVDPLRAADRLSARLAPLVALRACVVWRRLEAERA